MLFKQLDEIENINQLPKKYLTRNDELADAASIFLNNILTNKTLINSFGMGIDGKFDKLKFNDFVNEINQIINVNL